MAAETVLSRAGNRVDRHPEFGWRCWIALGAVLRCNSHIDQVAFNQHGGIHDVLIGTKDGQEGAVGR